MDIEPVSDVIDLHLCASYACARQEDFGTRHRLKMLPLAEDMGPGKIVRGGVVAGNVVGTLLRLRTVRTGVIEVGGIHRLGTLIIIEL
jgi:hypothetical protein